MWFIMALLSAVLAGIRRSGEKSLLSKLDHFTLGWLVQLASLPFVVGALLVTHSWLNPLHLGGQFWWPLGAVTILFYPVNTWLFYKALHGGELSKVLPVQSIMPMLTMFLSWVLIREAPTTMAVLGIALIVLGLYVINLNGKKLHNPFRPFLEDKSTLYMLGSTAAVALVGPLDKLAVNASNPLFYTMASTAGAVAMLFTIAKLGGQTTEGIGGYSRSLLTIGALQGSAYAAFIIALSLGPVAYVNSVKSGGVLIGAVSGIIWLKEPITRYKITSFALIAAGTTLLALIAR
jgi:uncharacterized membrane protein